MANRRRNEKYKTTSFSLSEKLIDAIHFQSKRLKCTKSALVEKYLGHILNKVGALTTD